MNKLKFSLSIGLILLIGLSTNITTNADINSKIKSNTTSIETDSLVVEIKGGGNVPFFFYWQKGAENTTYKIQLSSIFEVEDNNNNGIYDHGSDKRVPTTQVSLSSLTWLFSDFDVETDNNNVTTAIHFNLTSYAGNGKKDDGGLYIQFRMHVTAANEASIKFDVVIDNYAFKNETSILVVGFKLISTGNGELTQNDDTATFGNGYFQSEPTAQDDNGTINVGLSTGLSDGNKNIYLTYEQFNGRIVHDPVIGVGVSENGDSEVDASTNANTDVDGATDQNSVILPELSRGALFASTFFATFAFLLIPAMIYRFKRKSY